MELTESIIQKLNFLSSIADQAHHTPEEKQRHRFLIYMGVLMSFGGILWGTITVLGGIYYQSLIPYGYFCITILNFIYLYNTKNFPTARFVQVLISLLLPFLLQWSLGGFVASGGVMI